MRRQGRGIDARWEQMEYKSSASTWRILECLVVPNMRMNSKDAYSNKILCLIICILEPPPIFDGDYEDVRVVKETGLRSVGASLVGSTPTPRKEFVWFSQNLLATSLFSDMV